jgi:outer membrane lipoprotein-sorting protein
MMNREAGDWGSLGEILGICRRFLVAMATFAIVGAALTWQGASLYAQGKGGQNLESVFRELDARAKDFHSVSADIERTKVTVVVNDKSTESGSIKVRGDRMLLDLTAPDPRTILRSGDSLFVYTPGLKRVEEYNLGKNRALLDQFLLLGFGTDSQEMRKSYLVTYMKEEKIDEHKVIELELTPKMEAVRSQISKIQIWLDESSWLPVQQEFFEAGSGDYSIVKYSKIVRNPELPDSQFKPRWPKGTERIHPQGL